MKLLFFDGGQKFCDKDFLCDDKKKSRHRTTLPHSYVQYHRREASYRSCSGWEREFQACCRHREKIYKEEGRRVGKRGMMQIRLCVRVICITDKS